MPMIYTSQEVGLNKRLKFFDKDNIDWSDPKQFQPFYKKLVSLHTANPALWSGESGGMPFRINSEDPTVYAFKRTKDSNTVIAIMNFTAKPQACKVIDETVAGTYQDYFTGETFELSTSKPLALTPWQYLVFVK